MRDPSHASDLFSLNSEGDFFGLISADGKDGEAVGPLLVFQGQSVKWVEGYGWDVRGREGIEYGGIPLFAQLCQSLIELLLSSVAISPNPADDEKKNADDQRCDKVSSIDTARHWALLHKVMRVILIETGE
jgi:hypothetical protein